MHTTHARRLVWFELGIRRVGAPAQMVDAEAVHEVPEGIGQGVGQAREAACRGAMHSGESCHAR